MVEINWNEIRALEGSKNSGFEELCAQLARNETPADAKFIRKGTPDAGVECFSIFPDESEWGWQAKYIFNLGDSQWGQIDRSVEKALDNHPKLVKYIICVPKNRADGGNEGQTSALDRWNTHVEKWSQWATERDMEVDFVYWGQSELIDRLSLPENIGRMSFWFDVRGFDQAWFEDRLNEATKSAGNRYTPEINVELPIARNFEAFGRTDYFFDQIRKKVKYIRNRFIFFNFELKDSVNPEIIKLTSKFLENMDILIPKLNEIIIQPIGEIPFLLINEQISIILQIIEDLNLLLIKFENDTDGGDIGFFAPEHPFDSSHFRYRLSIFSSCLQQILNLFQKEGGIANNSVMVLKGDAGTGKTHLLCDIAKKRIEQKRPTILLMGQRFISLNDPWQQILQSLDLSDQSVEQFVGSLECSAQVNDCRAIVFIDAINEGKGKDIWPSNIAAFVSQIERSPWISVVFSVRTCYEDIIPEDVKEQAAKIVHFGFVEKEYDAIKIFFRYYGIELPSTPLLSSEFNNPLFLKILCQGLKNEGKHQLPRGSSGISKIFRIFIDSVNKEIARELNFNPSRNLVYDSLQALAKEMFKREDRWITLLDAEEIINSHLPGRDYNESLYFYLISEGLIIDAPGIYRSTENEDVIFITYDRLADHLIAETLLDSYLDNNNPEIAFSDGGPLSYLNDENYHIAPGLLESLCIQVPERTNKELFSLAPKFMECFYAEDSFRKSLIWRDINSFSDETLDVLDRITKTEYDLYDTFETLLNVAIIPDHPYNAKFLNHYLFSIKMPDRDGSWSIFLHKKWDSGSATDRLVEWVSLSEPGDYIEEEALDLYAITLSWMLTSSNRFLRDRVTKALVDLLTDHIDSTIRLIDNFLEVDDLYILERVFAVAYGVAMRSYDVNKVGTLAQFVYDNIFKNNSPPAHILLRDYARGIVERAIFLKSDIKIIEENIRPPYDSIWPKIPSEDDIIPFMPDHSTGSYDKGELEWSRNRIGYSIMSDDFAHYIIGTNSGYDSNRWLSLRIEDPVWQYPEERMDLLYKDMTKEEKEAYDKYYDADDVLDKHLLELDHILFLKKIGGISGDKDDNEHQDEVEINEQIKIAKERRNIELSSFRSIASKKHLEIFDEILPDLKSKNKNSPPRLNLKIIQRYVLWRVFDLGWTIERFGEFDRFYIGFHGREASKAERIGKKYQWIAYHEILAYISDHYQYLNKLGTNIYDRNYLGPWQLEIRDIDPSCTLCSPAGGTSIEGNFDGWWVPSKSHNWGEDRDFREWVLNKTDIPNIEELLVVTNPDDGTEWINIQGDFIWARPPLSLEKDSVDIGTPEIFYSFVGYLVDKNDVSELIELSRGADLSDTNYHQFPIFHNIFAGEYGWSPAFHFFKNLYCLENVNGEWFKSNLSDSIKLRPMVNDYSWSIGGLDCSQIEGLFFRLPINEIIETFELQWSGIPGEYLDKNGEIAVFDPTSKISGPDALLFRKDIILDYLKNYNLAIYWTLMGKKYIREQFLDASSKYPTLNISGAYCLDENLRLNGYTWCQLRDE